MKYSVFFPRFLETSVVLTVSNIALTVLATPASADLTATATATVTAPSDAATFQAQAYGGFQTPPYYKDLTRSSQHHVTMSGASANQTIRLLWLFELTEDSTRLAAKGYPSTTYTLYGDQQFDMNGSFDHSDSLTYTGNAGIGSHSVSASSTISTEAAVGSGGAGASQSYGPVTYTVKAPGQPEVRETRASGLLCRRHGRPVLFVRRKHAFFAVVPVYNIYWSCGKPVSEHPAGSC